MAKKRHPKAAQRARDAATDAPRAPRPAPPPAPRAAPGAWWFDFRFDRDHLALFRFAFFAILAIDAFFQIRHAPRYGAGDFNVPQLGWLPLPAPSRQAVLAIELVLVELCTLAAFGVATRVVVPLAALLDAYVYFASQLDSYQHHYLVALLLGIASFVPWHARERRPASAALRLFMVQLAILYAWAAIAKLDPRWLDGTTIDAQLRPAWVRSLVAHTPGHYATVAVSVVLGELLLAVAWATGRLRGPALLVGIAFHVGVELAGFQIGQFSYVMLACYLLMLPTSVGAWPARRLAPLARALDGRGVAAIGLGVASIALAAIGWHVAKAPVSAGVIATIAGIGAIALGVDRRRAFAAAQLAAAALAVLLGTVTDQAVDYYRLWAGAARRLGRTAEMRTAYEQLLEVDPGHPVGNYYLGLALTQDGRYDEAIACFRRTQAGQPQYARGYVGEARAQLLAGHADLARAAAEAGLRAEPGNADAADVLRQLGGRAPSGGRPNDDATPPDPNAANDGDD